MPAMAGASTPSQTVRTAENTSATVCWIIGQCVITQPTTSASTWPTVAPNCVMPACASAPPIQSVNWRSAVVSGASSGLANVRPSVSTVDFSASTAPAMPAFCALARSAAAPLLFTAALISVNPAVPAFSRMLAARIASVPKIVCSACAFCSCVSLPVAPCSWPRMDCRSFIWPLLSYTLTPRSFSVPAASLDGDCRLVSIVFRLVPASDPCRPALASRLIAVTVS